MADEGAAKIRELLGQARDLSKQASDLWETARRTGDEDAAQRMSDRAYEIESKAEAIRTEYTELTGINFNSKGEPDPYVIGDDGVKADDPSTLASAGLDPTLMTKAQQQDAHTELAAAEKAERAEQVEQAAKDYVAEVLDVDTAGLSDDQLRDLVAKNQGAFDLDYAAETGELKQIEEVLGVDVSDLTFDEVKALTEANKQKFEQFDARQMGVADMDIDRDAFSPDEVARLEEIKAGVNTELALNVPEGLEGKIVRIDGDAGFGDVGNGAAIDSPSPGSKPGSERARSDNATPGDDGNLAAAAARRGADSPGLGGAREGTGGDGPIRSPGADPSSPTHSSPTEPLGPVDETESRGSSEPGDAGAPPSPVGNDGSPDNTTETAPATSPSTPSSNPSNVGGVSPADSGTQDAVPTNPNGGGTAGETVDIVLTVTGVAGDIDFHMSSDGRWFDEAGHEVADPQRLHLDSLFESYTAQGGWPTDGTVSELEVSDTSFEDFVAEVADTIGTDASDGTDGPDGSDTSAGDPDPDTSASDGSDSTDDQDDGTDSSDTSGANDSDESDDTSDSSDGTDGDSDSSDDSSDDSDTSDDGDDGSAETSEVETDGDGTDAGDAEDTAEDRGPEGEHVRDVADTLNDPSFQIRVEAGRTGDVTPDPMASGLDSPSTPPITQTSGAPGPDVVVNPGEDELLVREADVEARLASSNYGQGAIDYGDDGPPDLPDDEGGPAPGNPDPVTADVAEQHAGAAVFASATEAVDVQLDADLDAVGTSGFDVAEHDANTATADDLADE